MRCQRACSQSEDGDFVFSLSSCNTVSWKFGMAISIQQVSLAVVSNDLFCSYPICFGYGTFEACFAGFSMAWVRYKRS